MKKNIALVFAVSALMPVPSWAQEDVTANTTDKEFTREWTDCKIFTDAIKNGNGEIAAHKISGIIGYIDKINAGQKSLGRPTFDLNSTSEKKEALIKQVYMRCLEDPSGVVVDKTIAVYKIYAAMSGYAVPN